MLKEWYNKYKIAELIFMIFLALNFFNNNSYAVTYEEFYTIMENNVGNINQNIFNWWNGLKGQETTISLMQSNWQTNNSIAVYGYYTSTYGWMGMVYFIRNNGNVYRYNEGISWTVGRDGWMGYGFTKTSFNLNSNGGNRSNFIPSNSDVINFGHIFNDSNTSWIFITDSEIYTDSTITEETSDTWYFKTYSLTSTNFEKYQSNLDYSDNYTYLGKITGEDLSVWRTRAILYQNGGIIASYNEIGLGGNIENGMIARKSNNLDNDDIYIYVRTSLLYPNKIYSLDVYYDEDENILEFNETYNFSIGSGDTGYTSQNSTNDIINNQNQNTNDIVKAIESGDKEQQNFIQQKVNEIFGVNSGDLNERLDKFIENINLPSGELEIDKSILGIITQDAGDFIISWQTVETPFLTISGDSINFSALCRSNEELAKLKEWLNIILSLFCFGALLTNFWNSLLLTLGISTYIYEKQSAELEKAAKQEARKQIRLEKEHEKGYQAFKRRNGK